MKNLQKKLSLVLCIVLIVSTLSSCGLFGSSKQEKKEEAGESESVESTENMEGVYETESDLSEVVSTENDSNTENPNKETQQTTENGGSSKQESQNDKTSSNNQQNNNQQSNNQGSSDVQSDESATGERMAKNIVNQIIKPGMSDFEKALEIHDWLLFNVDYDHTYSNYHAVNAFVDKRCVCQGYAEAFELMAEAAGLEATFVSGVATNGDGQTQSHAWNQVLINGNWYNVDVTWDDPTYKEKNFNDHSGNCYDYFLVSKAQLEKDHRASDYREGEKSCSSNYDKISILKAAANSGRYGDVEVITSISEANAGIKRYMDKNKSTMTLWIYDSSVTVATSQTYIQNLVAKVQYVINVGTYYPSDNGIIKCPIGITPSSEWNAIPVVTNVEGFKALLDQKGDEGITSYTVRYESTSGKPVISASKYGCSVSYVTYNDGNSWLVNVTIQ